ncbi:hypothetical protein, partial [Escherichia coli]|uniref:hypothetical protein n=1 Tax=Escherichia coli TaxID=562 RepID=UPI0024AF19A9
VDVVAVHKAAITYTQALAFHKPEHMPTLVCSYPRRTIRIGDRVVLSILVKRDTRNLNVIYAFVGIMPDYRFVIALIIEELDNRPALPLSYP